MNGTTLINISITGFRPYAIFVDIYNTLYVAETGVSRIQVWPERTFNAIRTISTSYPVTVFVTNNGVIYAGNSLNGQINKWTLNATNSVIVMNANLSCYGLFVDVKGYIYCVYNAGHQIVKTSPSGDINKNTVVAGTGSAGSTSNTLRNPLGIFVDINLKLYVADCHNNRIQAFEFGQLNGTTLAGTGASGTISLNAPTDVMLDADGYLFILDYGNARVVGSSSNGFRCLIGCSDLGSGSTSSQLLAPRSLRFDNYGNIFVADSDNSRIQKFTYETNSCRTYK